MVDTVNAVEKARFSGTIWAYEREQFSLIGLCRNAL
jgi:hypothetical protein